MNIADKLITIAENEQLVANANAELEEALYSASEGGKSYYDLFWDSFQNYGRRTVYPNAFSYSELTDDTFKPKYDLNVTDAYYMFFGNCGITDLKNLDVKLDFSQCDDLRNAFYGMLNTDRGIGLKRVGVIDGRASNRGFYTFQGLFEWDIYLEEVEKIIVREDGSQGFPNTFGACYNLTEIEFEGVIGQDISFADCPLSKKSIISVIKALSPSVSGKTVTFNKSAKEAAFTTLAEWNELIDEKDGWTITLAEEG